MKDKRQRQQPNNKSKDEDSYNSDDEADSNKEAKEVKQDMESEENEKEQEENNSLSTHNVSNVNEKLLSCSAQIDCSKSITKNGYKEKVPEIVEDVNQLNKAHKNQDNKQNLAEYNENQNNSGVYDKTSDISFLSEPLEAKKINLLPLSDSNLDQTSQLNANLHSTTKKKECFLVDDSLCSNDKKFSSNFSKNSRELSIKNTDESNHFHQNQFKPFVKDTHSTENHFLNSTSSTKFSGDVFPVNSHAGNQPTDCLETQIIENNLNSCGNESAANNFHANSQLQNPNENCINNQNNNLDSTRPALGLSKPQAFFSTEKISNHAPQENTIDKYHMYSKSDFHFKRSSEDKTAVSNEHPYYHHDSNKYISFLPQQTRNNSAATIVKKPLSAKNSCSEIIGDYKSSQIKKDFFNPYSGFSEGQATVGYMPGINTIQQFCQAPIGANKSLSQNHFAASAGHTTSASNSSTFYNNQVNPNLEQKTSVFPKLNSKCSPAQFRVNSITPPSQTGTTKFTQTHSPNTIKNLSETFTFSNSSQLFPTFSGYSISSSNITQTSGLLNDAQKILDPNVLHL